MTRLINFAKRHPLIALLSVALTAVPIGLLVATAAPPDPGVRQLPMSWQRTPEPVPNTGADAGGLTLEQWTRGTNAAGQSLEAWAIAGGDPKLWVPDVRTQRRAEDWRPVVSYLVKAGGPLRVLRYQSFSNKMAEPWIERQLFCGEGVTGESIDLGRIRPPTLTDGAAVKNHMTFIPAHVLPAGVAARTCEYRSRAEFIMNPVRTATMHFPAVKVTIVR